MHEGNYFTKNLKCKRRGERFATEGNVKIKKVGAFWLHLELQNVIFSTSQHISFRSLVIIPSFSALPMSLSFAKFCQFCLGSSFRIAYFIVLLTLF